MGLATLPDTANFMNPVSKFIAIEGLDGSGKSTQIDLLIRHFEQLGTPTKFIHFPRHETGVFGSLISRFLRGEFGRVDQVHPQLVALIFAEDRKDFAATLRKWLDDGNVVLVDRYVLSNIAFQCAKTTDPAQRDLLKRWILEFEFEYNNIPRPDLSIYLEVPFSFTEKSLTRRLQESRDYLNGQEDIHEQDFSLQRAVKSEYEQLVRSDKSVTSVVCYGDDLEMKPVEVIHQEILNLLKLEF